MIYITQKIYEGSAAKIRRSMFASCLFPYSELNDESFKTRKAFERLTK